MGKDNTENSNLDDSSDEDFLATMRERFDLAVEADSEIRREQLDDQKFLIGEQWPANVKQQREVDMRPCLTINRLTQSVHQVTNDQRQNRPAIKVNPVDDKATIDTAKVFQGMIRHIEYNSNADVAYDTAFEHTAGGGRGWLRVITDYCDPYSFDQEILIKRVRNAFSVYFDPSSQEPDGSDGNWAFVFMDMSRDDYKAQFPKSKMSGMSDWESIGDRAPGWANKSSVRIAEYFYKTFEEITIVHLSNDQIVDKSDLPKDLPDGIEIVDERKSVLPAIKWCKTNGIEKLEETDWLGSWIPVLPVLGDEMDIDGKLTLKGMVRDAKDPQRMYNYMASAEAETIALAPKAPFIGAEGQFEGFESQWNTANTKNHAFLQYKTKTLGGVPVGPPTRNVYEPAIQAITQARMQSADDLKVTTGIYDASLGNRSNEVSGIAINQRNRQAQTSNFHLIDNMSRTQRHLGRVLVDLIPKVYNKPQAVRTIAEDGEIKMVTINRVFQEQGKDKIHLLSAGRYDVTINSGPSFESKRQEAASSMSDLSKAYPQLMQFAGDIMVRNMDWPGAQEIADRLKKTLPPGLAEDKDSDQPPLPPQVQQQLSQQSQMIKTLSDHLNEKTKIVEEKTLELESKERIAMAQIQSQIEIAMAQMGSAEAQTLLKQQVLSIQHRLDLLHASAAIDNENEMAAGDQTAAPPPSPQQQPTGGLPPGPPMGS